MANFAEVLKELRQERSRLDRAIQAIGELVTTDHSGAANREPKVRDERFRRRHAGRWRQHNEHDGQR